MPNQLPTIAMTDLYRPRPDRLVRLRFRLRTMFVLLTVLAVSLGWVGVQLKWIRERHEVMSRSGDRTHGWLGTASAPWGLRMFGEQGREKVFAPASELERMQALFPESEVITFDYGPSAPH